MKFSQILKKNKNIVGIILSLYIHILYGHIIGYVKFIFKTINPKMVTWKSLLNIFNEAGLICNYLLVAAQRLTDMAN